MSETNSLTIFTRASVMLAEADTIQKAKELKSLALTAADWAKRKGMGEEAIQHCRSYALEAERKMGEMLAETERAKPPGDNQHKKQDRLPDVTEAPTLKEIGVTKRESAEAQMLYSIPRVSFDKVKSGEVTRADVKREIKRKEIITQLESVSVKKAKATSGVYDVLVIDPPWPMQKIEREVRPNQSELDYPTMTCQQLSEMKIPAAENCHVWLWTTHRFMPIAFDLLESWGISYVCCFVWHKPGGFQAIGLPQYNCEFCLYARKGYPKFIDTKAFNVCFNAQRGAHSEKPSEFYDVVRRVTAGRRLDMFNRRHIEGFDGWGKEAK